MNTLQTAPPQGGVLRHPRPSWVRFRLSWCVPTHPSASHAAMSKYSPVLRCAGCVWDAQDVAQDKSHRVDMGSGQDTPGRAGRARTSARTKRQFAEWKLCGHALETE
eukprot:363572-Chlamydomonas_euryale.AAC.7